MTLTFNPLSAMVMSYSCTKAQGQWSVSSEDRVETNGWTDGQMDGGDQNNPSLANAVGKYRDSFLLTEANGPLFCANK